MGVFLLWAFLSGAKVPTPLRLTLPESKLPESATRLSRPVRACPSAGAQVAVTPRMTGGRRLLHLFWRKILGIGACKDGRPDSTGRRHVQPRSSEHRADCS